MIRRRHKILLISLLWTGSLFSQIPEWLNRIDYSVEFVEHGRPSWMVETIQPLPFSPCPTTDILFWQGRLAHRHGDQTVNLGLGYRKLLCQNRWLLGINGFFDWKRALNYRRYSIGIECLGDTLALRANHYDTLSGRKKLSNINNVIISERSLDGYDVELEVQIPFLPWVSLSGTGFHWKGHSLRSFKGFEVSALMHLAPWATLRMGKSLDNFCSQSFIQMEVRWGQPCSIQYTLWDCPLSHALYSPYRISHRALEKVHRHHDLVIERRIAGGQGIIIGRGA